MGNSGIVAQDAQHKFFRLGITSIAASDGHMQVMSATLLGPGDCVATGMGHHHDFPIVVEPVRAVFFETTMQGRKRRGHLWNHRHGPAEPRGERA